jgi:hypothetical protein
MTDEEKLECCANTAGLFCCDHFYNGYNNLGIEKCWSFDTAVEVERDLHLTTQSTKTVKVTTLRCFRPQYNLKQKWVKEAGLA